MTLKFRIDPVRDLVLSPLGICMADRDRQRLSDGPYRVDIDSRLEPGSLSYGELLILD